MLFKYSSQITGRALNFRHKLQARLPTTEKPLIHNAFTLSSKTKNKMPQEEAFYTAWSIGSHSTEYRLTLHGVSSHHNNFITIYLILFGLTFFGNKTPVVKLRFCESLFDRFW